MASKPPADRFYEGEVVCPKCEEEFLPDSFWDGGDSCPWCQAEVEWECEGGTDSGWFVSAVKLAEKGCPSLLG